MPRYDRELTIEELAKIDDNEIDYSEIPELGDEFFANAKVVNPPQKVHVSIRIDEDVVNFFKQGGRGWQTRMNEVLKLYKDSQKRA